MFGQTQITQAAGDSVREVAYLSVFLRYVELAEPGRRGAPIRPTRAWPDPAAPYRPMLVSAIRAERSALRCSTRKNAPLSPLTDGQRHPRSLLVNERNYASLGLTKLWPMRDAFHWPSGQDDGRRKENIESDEVLHFCCRSSCLTTLSGKLVTYHAWKVS